jgi:hypothetical protein
MAPKVKEAEKVAGEATQSRGVGHRRLPSTVRATMITSITAITSSTSLTGVIPAFIVLTHERRHSHEPLLVGGRGPGSVPGSMSAPANAAPPRGQFAFRVLGAHRPHPRAQV